MTATITLPTPSGGTATGSVAVAAGPYTVSYAPPAGYALAPGDSATRTITVVGGQVTSVSYTVTAVQAGPDVIFHSDWSTATGTASNAVRDGGVWTGTNISSTSLATVVPAAGIFSAGFANTFRAELQANKGASVNVSGLPAPAVGQSRYWRFYLYVDYPDSAPSDGSGGNHGFWTHGPTSSDSDVLWAFHWGHTKGSSKIPNFMVQTYGGTPGFYILGNVLSMRTPYRVEVKATRTSTTGYTLDVRIYNENSTTPLYTGANFINSGNGTALNAAKLVSSTSPAWDALAVGQNGISNWTWGAGPLYHYVGAVCIRSANWCGPYNGGI